MKSILSTLDNALRHEYAMHYVWTFYLQIIMLLVFNEVDWYVALPVLLLVVAKELYDEYVKGSGFSMSDLSFSILGQLTAILLFLFYIK